MRAKKNIRWLKISILTLICCMTFPMSHPALAQNDPDTCTLPPIDPDGNDAIKLLRSIKNNTYLILCRVNRIPVYLTPVMQMAEEWLKKADSDSSNTIGNNQASFAAMSEASKSINDYQYDTTKSFTEDFLKAGTVTTKDDKTLRLPPNANQLSYSILVNKPLVDYQGTDSEKQQKLNDDIKAYVKNVTGSKLVLSQPSPEWDNSQAKTNYTELYNMMSAVQSYSSFILSSLYYQGSVDDSTKKLIEQASNSDWFTRIGSETLGLVLRHILMYDSEMFVQITRMQQMQQQQLTLQAMNNAMLATYVENALGDNLAQKAARGKTSSAPNAQQVNPQTYR